MSTRSRRRFVSEVAAAGAALLAPRAAAAAAPSQPTAAKPDERLPLDGTWEFRLDAEKTGDRDRWHLADAAPAGWAPVTVPHTWQIEPASAEYLRRGLVPAPVRDAARMAGLLCAGGVPGRVPLREGVGQRPSRR